MEESDVWGSTTHTAVPERKGRDCIGERAGNQETWVQS